MPAPGAPNIFRQPRSTNQALEFRWNPPTDDGGSPITHYRLQLNAETPIVVAANVYYYKVTGLTNGTDYTASLEASNDSEASWGTKAFFRIFQPGSAKPAAPSTVLASSTGISSAIVSWTPPTVTPDSPIQWYVIMGQSTTPGVPILRATADGLTQTSYLFSNLSTSQAYFFDIYAVNCPGYSPARRTATVSPLGVTTSSLTMFMDSRRAASYPGSGTTWSNIASTFSTIHYTLSNVSRSTIVYNSTSNASMIFNSANYIFPTGSMLGMLTANIYNETREMWFYWTGTAGVVASEQDNISPGSGWNDFQMYVTAGSFLFGYWNNQHVSHTLSTGITSNQWYHIVYQYSLGSNLIMGYVNGVRTLSNASAPRLFPGGAYFLLYGANSAGQSGRFSGAIPVLRYYNRILASNEITSNFTLERAQFGV